MSYVHKRATHCLFQVALALSVALLTVFSLPAQERPNVLLIVADDLCWRDFNFVGNNDVHTPNIDKLAASGMHLTKMFSPASTCSPTRHALYTGMYCMRIGAYPNHTLAYDGTKSIFSHLKAAGYRVGLQNKSHVAPKETFPYENLKGKNQDDFDVTRKFITRQADQPWFLVFASHDPHTPWTRGPQDRYDAKKLTVPAYLHDNETTRQELVKYYAEITMLDTQVGNLMTILDESKQRENTIVIFVSEQGSSFPYGAKWCLWDNGIRTTTVVSYPNVITPGSKADALCQYVDLAPTILDFAGVDPTKIDTGCPDSTGYTGFDGNSIRDLLTGKSTTGREFIFAQNTTVGVIGYKDPYPSRCVRDVRYKYIRNLAPENTYHITGIQGFNIFKSWENDAKNDVELKKRVDWLSHRTAEELYDLDNDPYENTNLAADPKLAAVKERLSNALDAWMKQQGDEGMKTEMNAKNRQAKTAKKNGNTKK